MNKLTKTQHSYINLTSITNICTIIAVLVAFYSLSVSVHHFNASLENRRIERRHKWKANIALLEGELKQNQSTAQFIIEAANEHERTTHCIPSTIYIATSLNQIIQSDFLLEEGMYSELHVLNKLLLTANKMLDNTHNIRHTHLLVNDEKQRRYINILLDEEMSNLKHNAESINRIVGKLIGRLPDYYK